MATSKRAQETSESGRADLILHVIAAVIALLGLADATYLAVQFLTGEAVVCGGSAECSKVLGSSYARVGPVPIAAFGVLAYFAAFTCAVFAVFDYARMRRLFAIVVWTMFAMTLWLLFVQAVLLHAFCRYCLLSAALVFVLAAIVVLRPPAR